ncbi:MAG: 1,4-alpha-glucan branching protein GlgB [Firmicutes bacterium]|nr:1,4-alpha-glucan branching protein GlgB [Bacillota bacterium]
MDISTLSDYDLYLYHQGTNYHSYQMFGAHCVSENGEEGVRFSVWAPNAQEISVVGDFNNWQQGSHRMARIDDSSIWVLFVANITVGTVYKYAIQTNAGYTVLKTDPYGFYAEIRPNTASIVYDLGKFQWSDQKWQKEKKEHTVYETPMLTYELHLGSWRRNGQGDFLTYRESAEELVAYVKQMHYTHIELMPLCEYPFDGSWGYQATGYYAVTSRYGEPCDFMYLVNLCHENNIGVILDWVPGHFCRDEHGLRHFDGGPLYESNNSKRAENYEWGTTNFDYGRTEVQSFLISNAMFFFELYHIDGLRIDAVANMLYLNYGRKEEDREINKYGGDGNLEAMEFLRKLNHAIFEKHPNALMIAEESTSWPLISKPVYMGGMGFNFKWNMGWMNDMLRYMSMDPIYRQFHHNLVTFSFMYAFSENFVLPLSHDEVVHGKCSLINKMPGDYWQKFANLRAFYSYWLAHPGKKLLFMGSEFGQFIEWKYDDSLDWHLLDYPMHHKLHEYVKQSNAFYCEQTSFWQIDCDWQGFEWIDCNDNRNSVISFIRKGKDPKDFVIVICNFTPAVHQDYRVGVPLDGTYIEAFNSDSENFGGSNVINEGDFIPEKVAWHGKKESIRITIPPLATIYLKLKKV